MELDPTAIVGEDMLGPGGERGGKTTLAESTAAKLRDMIAQNVLPPGARIRERAIANDLRISRTPMREALRILAAERLVEIQPNRGAVVADPAPEEIRDLLRLLGTLEALAGELAANEASDQDIAEIRALHFEMLASFERDDRLAYFKLNQAIHRGLVLSSKNEPLIEIHGQVNARLYRIRYQSNLRNRNWRKAIEEHEVILEQLTRRNAAALSRTLRAHLQSTWQNVSRQIGEPV